MAAADTANLLAALTLKDGFTAPLKKMDGALSRFDAHLSKTQNRSLKAGQQIGTGIKNAGKIAAVGIGLLATQVVLGLNSLAKLEEANAQTEAAIKSTGGVARLTAGDIRSMAEEMENLNATIDDKVIQSAENMLLTFTNVRKEAFEPALLAALNLNTAMGGGEEGLQGTIIKVGKALNDPVKGLTALSRVGVKFTDQQKKQIKALQESGDLLGAQQIILKELGTEFGGRFAAQGKTATGTVAGIGDAVEDLQKTVATGLFPVIQKLLPKIRDALADPQLIATVGKIGDKIAGLFSDENIRTGTRLLTDFFESAKKAAPALQRAAEVTGQVIKTAVDAFRSLPPEIQSLAIAGLAINKLTGGLVTNLAGGLISAVISSFRGLMNVNAAVVNVNGAGIPGIPGTGGGIPGWNSQAGSGGGVRGLVQGLPMIGIGIIAAEAAKTLSDAVLGGVKTGLAERGVPSVLTDPSIDAGNALTDLLSGHPLDALNRLPDIIGGVGDIIALTGKKTDVIGEHTTDAIENARRDANRADDRTFDSIEKLRSGTQLVDVTNADSIGTAVARATSAELRAIFKASGEARGVKNAPGASKTLKPRLDFLAGGASGSKDVAVARSLTTLFEQSNAPLYRNTANLLTTIKALKADAKTLGPKSATTIGGYIKRLQAEVKRRKLEATVNNTVNVSTILNGRVLQANVERFTTKVDSGAPVTAFGGQ